MTLELSPEDRVRAAWALGWRPDHWRAVVTGRVPGGAGHWVVGDGAGRTAFLKFGTTPVTVDWLRAEARTYAVLDGPFLPEVFGFDDDGERPVLALEDLSSATWPPPWTRDDIDVVLSCLDRVSATAPPPHLPRLERGDGADWRSVTADPEPFLRLGICTRSWLGSALPVLAEAADTVDLRGDALVHGDIRSDNVCFRSLGVVLIDWNHAAVGNPQLDLAAWLPSLHDEGGPPPDELLPDAPALAAWVAGYFCARAGDPEIPDAVHVRPLQVRQARTALPWAARVLGLPPPV